MGPQNEDFNYIKRDLVNRVTAIEKYIAEGNEQRKHIHTTLEKLNRRLNGDFDSLPPIPGFEQRLKYLEINEKEREVTKENMLKVAVGALTMAIGGAVIWMLTAIKEAFLKNGRL